MSAWVKGQQRWDLSQTRQWLCPQGDHAMLPVWGGGVGIGHATRAKCKHLKRLPRATFVDQWTCPSTVLTRGNYGKVKTLKCWQILTKPVVVIIFAIYVRQAMLYTLNLYISYISIKWKEKNDSRNRAKKLKRGAPSSFLLCLELIWPNPKVCGIKISTLDPRKPD